VKDNNCTVLTESVHSKQIDLGSGVLAHIFSKGKGYYKFILTAAHCTSHKDHGEVEIVEKF